MRLRRGGFEQQQAVFGRGGKKPAATRFFDEMFVVLRRLEAEQGEPKSILAARLAVAAAGVATGFRENGHDLIREIDRRNLVEMLDLCGQHRAQAVRSLRGDGCRAVAEGCDPAVPVDFNDVGRRHGIADLPREVAEGGVVELRRDQ